MGWNEKEKTMKTKKIYWKVVNYYSPYKSISAVVSWGKFCSHYEIGKITKSKVPETGLLVFDTREQARNFKNLYGQAILKVVPAGKEIFYPVYYDPFSMRNNDEKNASSNSMFPPGTRAFDAVKVIGKERD